jgi:CRP/FNR family cyclic AMP-dependent transcriptional regulator
MASHRTFWTELDANERATLLKFGHAGEYGSGDTLIQANSTEKNIVIILKGNVRVVADPGNGRAATLAIRGPGEVVGELAVLDGEPRYAAVKATGPVSGLKLRYSEISEAMMKHPRIQKLLTAVVTERLREADRRRVAIATLGVVPRTAAIIFEFANRETLADGGRPIGGRPIDLDIISQADLAGLVGTSRESLARALHVLRINGIIKTARGKITVLDIRRLSDMIA